MRYHELLSEYIDSSRLSLGEIAIRLSRKNIDISKSYISKLKTGSKPPASEDITRALAEVTGGDPNKLLIAGQMEKLTPLFENLGEEGFQAFLSAVSETFVKSMPLVEINKKIEEECNAKGLPFKPLTLKDIETAVSKYDENEKIKLSRLFSFQIESDSSNFSIPASIQAESLKESPEAYNATGGRAYYGGGDDWTEEEKAAADTFIEMLRKKKAEKENKQ